jgi:hypothetical protein
MAILNRREILGLVLAVLGGASAAHLTTASEAQKLTDNLGAIGSLDNLRMLGRHCLDLMPRDQVTLLKVAGIEELSTELHDQVAGFTRKRQEDFLLGRTQIVSGWVLADAECAICVLCSQA